MYICKKCGQEMKELILPIGEQYFTEFNECEFKEPYRQFIMDVKYENCGTSKIFGCWSRRDVVFHVCEPCNRKCTTDGKVYNLTTGEQIIEL
jgi:hypothetical protein